MKQQIDKPIIICGCQRSGTFLLTSILSMHSGIKILWETHFYPFFWSPFKRKSIISNQSLRIWKNSVSIKNSNFDSISEEIVTSGQNFRNVFELLISFLTELKREYKTIERVGEKTPSHIFYIKDMVKNRPNAQFLIMLRDPRAVILSEKKKYENLKKKHFSHFKMAVRWYISVKLAYLYLKKYKKNSIYIVKYEDLIKNPTDSLKSICSFLQVPLESKMLDASVVNSSFGKNNQTGFSELNIDRWKTMLSPEEIGYLDLLLAKPISKIGYEIHTKENFISKDKPKIFIHKVLLHIICQIGLLNPSLFHFIIKDNRYRKIIDWQ